MTETITTVDVPEAVLAAAYAAVPERHLGTPGAWETALTRDETREVVAAVIAALPDTQPAPELPDGQWLDIAFVGHIEYRGAYVREVTRNGQPAYRVEPMEYVFGGDPLKVRYHAASSWFGDAPTTEEIARKAWEQKQAGARAQRQREEQWRQQRELEAGAGEDPEDAWDDDRDPF